MTFQTSGKPRALNTVSAVALEACAVCTIAGLAIVGMPDAAAIETPPPGAIELSVDGVNWANPLTQQILNSEMTWVPGDKAISSIWVRTTCEAAIGIATWELEPDTPARFAQSLEVRTHAAGAEWSNSLSFANCLAYTEFTVTAGSPVKLDLEIAFPYGDATEVSANDTQGRVVEVQNAVITLGCDGTTTVRPAVTKCLPVGSAIWPGDGDGMDDGGSMADGDIAGSGSLISIDPTGDPASNITAAAQLRWGMARTGVEIARTLLACAALVFAGISVLQHGKRRRIAASGLGAGRG